MNGVPAIGSGITAAALEFEASAASTGNGGWYTVAWASTDAQPTNTTTLNTIATTGKVSNFAAVKPAPTARSSSTTAAPSP